MKKRKAWACEEIKRVKVAIPDKEFKERLADIWEILLNQSRQLEVISSKKDQPPIAVRDSELQRSAS